MKIAVQLDDNRNIIGTVTTNELGAELQVKLFSNQGWVLVDSDPTFSSAESYLWTIRKSDNKLVHVSTGLTPDEETKKSLTDLTNGQLKGQQMDNQFQQAVTVMTKQAIQDKLTSQMAITDLTKQVANLTAKLDQANGVDSAPEAPTDVTSTATTSGANITAK